MKLVKFLSVFVIVAIFSSCSKDDGPGYGYTKDNLTGTYSLVFHHAKEVRTTKIDGFDVVTTTVSEGDTFDKVTYSFSADNEVLKKGSYRIVETKTQNNQTQERSYIVNFVDERGTYSVQESLRKLTIDGVTYDVERFNETGFNIKRSEKTVDGETITELEEELRFQK